MTLTQEQAGYIKNLEKRNEQLETSIIQLATMVKTYDPSVDTDELLKILNITQ